jgi:tryptophan-rich sensory protein
MKFIICLLIPILVGGTAGFFTTSEIPGWYSTIQKPSFNPPNWIFGPVWTTLYILMGIASWFVLKSKVPDAQKQTALILYGVQLILTFFWSFIFFKQHQLGWAFAEILLLWLSIFITIILFSRIHEGAAWLLVPYISWVSFASILNFYIWQLNK